MKLIGYIKPYMDFSFTIPIYEEGNSYYYHELNDNFNIIGFFIDNINKSFILKFKKKINYKIGDKAPIVFVGENGKILINNSDSADFEIFNYLNRFSPPKMHIYEELFFLAKQNGNDVELYKNKVELMGLVYYSYPILNKEIFKIVDEIEEYLLGFKSKRKRKRSFKYLKKGKYLFGKHPKFYDQIKIDNLKKYIISDIKGNKIRKSFRELSNLFQYQSQISPPKLIVKSFCDISQSMLNYGYFDIAKILLHLSKLFETNDIVIDAQFAEILKAEGDLIGAKQKYLEIQDQFPNDVIVKNGYAEVLKAEGDLVGAKQKYLEIQDQFPNDVIAKSGYAEVLKAEGDLAGAKQKYLEIQDQFPNNKIAKTGYAEVLKAEGDLAGAKQKYLEIQDQFPNDVIAKNGYAEVLKAEGDLVGAKQKYLEIQDQFPNDVIAKNGFAGVLKAEGDLAGAMQKYLEIQKQFSNDLYSRQSLITCYLISNDLKSIDKSLFVKSNPISKDDYYFYHAYIMYKIRIGNYEEAEILLFNKINSIKFYKTKILFIQTHAYVRLLQKRYEYLLNEINNIFPDNGNNPAVNVFKTHIYSVNDKKDDAKKYLKMIKNFPSNSLIYTSATLLSERFNLNGLPKKGLDNDALDKLIEEEEFKLIGLLY
ncbi:MAG: hypothetical protein R2781_09560 [Flavobacteriaceae bacterium]